MILRYSSASYPSLAYVRLLIYIVFERTITNFNLMPFNHLSTQDANKMVIEANVKRMDTEKELQHSLEQVFTCDMN